MIYFQAISFFSFLLYLNLGLYVLYRDIRSPLHRNFFYFSFCLALWAFVHVFLFGKFIFFEKDLVLRISYIPHLFFIVFLLRFFLLFTGSYENSRVRIVFNLFAWIAPFYLSYKSITENAIAADFPDGLWFIVHELTATLYNTATVLVILSWWKRTKIKSEKKQAVITMVSGLAAIAVAWAADYIMGYLNYPSLASSTTVLWIFVLIYVMARFRFMRFTPDQAGRRILQNIDETAFLVNLNNRIVYSNSKKWDSTKANLPLSFLGNYIEGYKDFYSGFEKFLQSEKDSYSVQVMMKDEEAPAPATIRVKKFYDDHYDGQGVLILLKEMPGMRHMKNHFNLTAREEEVILNIVSGTTNKEIADKLNVTERTIKAHITNIYNKLGISNKIELFNILNEFNILEKPGLAN